MTKEVHHHHHHYHGTRRRRRPYWRTRHHRLRHRHQTHIHKVTKIDAEDIVGLIVLCVFVLIALATCA